MVSTPGFPDPEKFCLWNPLSENSFHVESGIVGFGILHLSYDWNRESKFHRKGIQNPSTWNPESTV